MSVTAAVTAAIVIAFVVLQFVLQDPIGLHCSLFRSVGVVVARLSRNSCISACLLVETVVSCLYIQRSVLQTLVPSIL